MKIFAGSVFDGRLRNGILLLDRVDAFFSYRIQIRQRPLFAAKVSASALSAGAAGLARASSIRML